MNPTTLTLTTFWRETKARNQTKELQHGMGVEYYGNGIDYPSQGIIEERDGLFVIVWEDTSHDTIIDGSEKSNKILAECGFTL